MEDIKQFIITSGGYMHHIGLLTDNTKRTLAGLSRMPGMGSFSTSESTWTKEEMIVGDTITMIGSSGKMFDGMLLEIIEPVVGKCENTHFADYMKCKGAGIHHICYGIPHYADYKKIYDHLLEIGCRVVLHGRKCDREGKVTDEFCYFEICENEVYLELCLTRYKWGY